MKKAQIFLYSCLAFVLGVGLRSFVEISVFRAFGVLILGLVVLIFTMRDRKLRVLGLVVIFLALGVLRFSLGAGGVEGSDIAFYKGQEVTFVGVVGGEPDVRIDNVKLRIKVREIKKLRNKEIKGDVNDEARGKIIPGDRLRVTSDFDEVSGKVLMTTNLYPEYKYGDELEIECGLEAPAKLDDFDYERYLARYDIYSVCYYPEIKLLSQNNGNRVYAGILRVKEKLKSVVEQGLPEPQASVLGAMALGSRRGISEELRDKFSRVGISHIMAISGLHITLLAGILMSMLIRLGFWRKQAFWIATGFLLLYIIMLGAPASAVRAGVMGFLLMLGMSMGRVSRSMNSLVFVAGLMLLVEPRILRDDVGFQLSFLAVLGIIYFSPRFQKWFKRVPQFLGMRDILVMTFSAQVLVLPLLAYHFRQVSIVAPVVNLLIIPILPLVLIFGFLGMLLGLAWLGLAKIFFIGVWILLSYLVGVVEFFGRFSLAGIEVG